MKSKLTVLTSSALVASLLVACGGGGSSSSGPALSKTEFVSQAGQICKETAAKTAQLQADVQKQLTAHATPAQKVAVIQGFLAKIAPLVRETFQKIGNLKPPPELQSKLDDLVKKANTATDQLAANPGKFAADALNGTTTANPFTDVHSAAGAVGLQNCGTSGG